MNNLKNRFKEFFKNGYFTRIDDVHVLDLYLGLNEKGQYTLEYRGNFNIKEVKGSSAIGVSQGTTSSYSYLLIFLKDTDMFDTFCALLEDIIETTRSCPDNPSGYQVVINRLYSWKKMFSSKKKKLDESAIMGLMGELIFLDNYMFSKYGKTKSLQAWSGQELTHKDFSLEDTWYEVKSIHSGKDSVRISSLEQLQSNNFGELVIISLERMSPAFNGVTLSKLANKIMKELDTDEDLDKFISKLSKLGFGFDSETDDYVYQVLNIDRYAVNSSFPKIIRLEIPTAIVQAQYDISITSILPFLINE
jgi:hypothetical protein